MKLIVGLGNPGKKYNDTRHNVGFYVLDLLESMFTGVNFEFANQLRDGAFEKSKKLESKLVELKDLGVVLAKPTTYMNVSGDAVGKLVRHFNVGVSNLWIIHDDLDLSFGSYKIQKDKGPKDHNGLNSIYESLGKKDFWHVRIGVDNRDEKTRKIPGEKYVLMKLNDLETEVRDEMAKKLVGELAMKLKV